MKLTPFDPAEYLDNEESIAAYLADARLDGAQSVARAEAVVERARRMHWSLPERPRKTG